MSLDLDALGSCTVRFTTVVEEEEDVGAGDQSYAQGHARLMRLATWIDLDSRISVSSNDPWCYLSLIMIGRLCWGSPQRCSTQKSRGLPAKRFGFGICVPGPLDRDVHTFELIVHQC